MYQATRELSGVLGSASPVGLRWVESVEGACVGVVERR